MSTFETNGARFRVINQRLSTSKGPLDMKCVYRDPGRDYDDRYFLLTYWDERGFTLAEFTEIAKREFPNISPDQVIIYIEKNVDMSHVPYKETSCCRFFISEKRW